MADVHGTEKAPYNEKVVQKDGSDYDVNHAGEPVGEEYTVDRKLHRQLKNRHIAMIR
jgi:amino acid permease